MLNHDTSRIQLTRTFKGQIWHLNGHYPTKERAQRAAEYARKEGLRACVFSSGYACDFRVYTKAKESKSILKGAVTEESTEFQAGREAGLKAGQSVVANTELTSDEALTQAHYAPHHPGVPSFVRNNEEKFQAADLVDSSGSPSSVFGMGFSQAVGEELERAGRWE